MNETICAGIRNHFKDKPQTRSKTVLINAVNLNKLSPTEKAFFLAADYQCPTRIEKVSKGKEEPGKGKLPDGEREYDESKED